MAHPFKEGDEVIFYQDKRTSEHFSLSEEMKNHFWYKVPLKVISVGTFSVNCMGPQDVRSWTFHYEDLKHAVDNRTKDEIYLDNLLKGAKRHDALIPRRR